MANHAYDTGKNVDFGVINVKRIFKSGNRAGQDKRQEDRLANAGTKDAASRVSRQATLNRAVAVRFQENASSTTLSRAPNSPIAKDQQNDLAVTKWPV